MFHKSSLRPPMFVTLLAILLAGPATTALGLTPIRDGAAETVMPVSTARHLAPAELVSVRAGWNPVKAAADGVEKAASWTGRNWKFLVGAASTAAGFGALTAAGVLAGVAAPVAALAVGGVLLCAGVRLFVAQARENPRLR